MPATPLTRDNPFLIVLNTASGSKDASQEQETITTVLSAAKQKFELLRVENPQDLIKIAKHAAEQAQRLNGAVIAAGGDGTINAVAQAALPTGRPFGIVPQGTFNYSSRAHGIPLETEAATQMLLNARCKPVQVGVVNERIFLVNASLGLYPQLLQDREVYKKQFGRRRSVALWAGLLTLIREHHELVLEIEPDGRREIVRTPTLFVGNNPLQLEQVGLPEAEVLERGRGLAAVIVKPVSKMALLGLAFRGALGQLGDAESVRDFVFRRMTVRPLPAAYTSWLRTSWHSRDGMIKVATDGEIWRTAPPIQFSIAPQPLMLMTPAQTSRE